MQLMSLFQKDDLHLHLQEEIKQCPDANLLLDAFPNPSYDISFPRQFDKSVSPDPKSRIDSFSCELFKTALLMCIVNYTQCRGGSRIDCRGGGLSIPRVLAHAKFYVLRPLLCA